MAVAPAILGEPTAEAGRPAARGPALMRMDAIDSIRVRCCCCCFIPRGFLLPPLLKLTRFHVFRYFCLQQQQRGGQTGKSNIISFPFPRSLPPLVCVRRVLNCCRLSVRRHPGDPYSSSVRM